MVSKIGSAVTGGLSGAGTGFALGGLPGGVAGALLGALASYLSAEPDKMGQVSLQTPQQQQGLSQILSNLQSQGQQGGNYQAAQNYLSALLNRDPSMYEKFAAPYMQQFEQQTIPMLAERFAGLGGGLGGGALTGSGFAQAAGGAGAQLQSQLANLYANLQRGAATESLGNYNQLASLGLGTKAFQPTYQPGTTGFAGPLTSGVAQGIGSYAGKGMMEDLFGYLGRDKRTGIDATGQGAVPGSNFGLP